MKCFYCGRPVEFNDITVDHVIPLRIAGDPKKLNDVLEEYQIRESFPDFLIDDLPNLVPSHGALCNFRKGDMLLSKGVTLFYLSRVHREMHKVVRELENLTTSTIRGTALGHLGTALERGAITEGEVLQLIRTWEFRRAMHEPLVVTFGLNFAETLELRGIVTSTTMGYPLICDRLEAELQGFVRMKTVYSFHYAEPSARNGETLSVRLVFPELTLGDSDQLPFDQIEKNMPWWALLEVSNFYQIYGQNYEDAFGHRLTF